MKLSCCVEKKLMLMYILASTKRLVIAIRLSQLPSIGAKLSSSSTRKATKAPTSHAFGAPLNNHLTALLVAVELPTAELPLSPVTLQLSKEPQSWETLENRPRSALRQGFDTTPLGV
jgi:hypothetical protein